MRSRRRTRSSWAARRLREGPSGYVDTGGCDRAGDRILFDVRLSSGSHLLTCSSFLVRSGFCALLPRYFHRHALHFDGWSFGTH
ncbi:hypothetical protein NECAME_14537 [Necator americanus]|uniref:Uncharacterized protein n=1 Tax=Necator americanus TaxID=51031 RepID=W2SMP3_NECAM|nr:hypothetical protein NECAME_14537 [Necator americanus]ETN70763.1 hypothetical protein NECAME_14537 [Necator americanus]